MARVVPVGIDLGTTLSAVSFVDENGETQMLRNEAGSVLTPSAVLFNDDDVMVGEAALKAADSAPQLLAENAKRDIGSTYYRKPIRGQSYPPEVIQGCILHKLQESIVSQLGSNIQVTITVPAYFDEARRKITADAGKMSGLPVLDIVNEPTAAALAFGERLGYLSPEGAPNDQLKLIVYDLGGGTFDVTVMQLSAGNLETLSTDGDYELGGNSWDARLAEYAEAEFRKQWPKAAEFDDRDQLRLLRAAKAAKHNLSVMMKTTLVFSAYGRELQLPVSRELFEELTADLVARTTFTTTQALRSANLLWDDIDRLLLVGGSTRMPAVARSMRELSGLKPDDLVNPDEAVARGAAVFARYLLGSRGIDPSVPKIKIVDVNSHGLGIEGVNQETLRVENVTIIPRNTQLPFEVTKKFVTKSDNQRSVKVQILEGESSLVDQCSPLAVAAIKYLPPNLPKGTPITVTYRFEENGRLAVTAGVAGVGDDAEIELERVRGLPENRVESWKEVICKDGGYRDFEDALTAILLSDDFAPVKSPQESEPSPPTKEQGTKPKVDLEAAIDHGAPLAASNKLKSETLSTKPSTEETDDPPSRPVKQEFRKVHNSRQQELSIVGKLLGHVIAGFVGVALGYYLLCWVRPDLNFLEINLPGLPRTKQPGQAQLVSSHG